MMYMAIGSTINSKQTFYITIRKRSGKCYALVCESNTRKNAWESGQDARFVQIDFSAAHDRVIHLKILYKYWSAGTGGFIFSCIDTVSIK